MTSDSGDAVSSFDWRAPLCQWRSQQVARCVSPERSYVVFQRLPRALTEADHPLLVPLGVLDQHSLRSEVDVP